MTIKAAIYLRISADKSGEELGVTRQREDALAVCERNGWTPVEYQDNDRSASKFAKKARDEYERMMEDIRSGDIGAVVVYKADRLHRRPAEGEAFIDLAERLRVSLVTLTGRFDLSTAEGRLMYRQFCSFAAYESEVKSERQLRAARQKAERGLPSWSEAFGYRQAADGSLEADPVTAPIVARMYAIVLAGGSLGDVRRMLEEAGHGVGLTGRPWTASTISLFLRAARNAGLRSHNDAVVGAGNWPALVAEQTWRSVQDILANPARRPGKKTVQRHLLTSLLTCGKCGSRMGAHQTASTRAIAYVCKNGTCRGCSIRAEHVEPILYAAVVERLGAKDAIDLLRAEGQDPAAAAAIKAQLAELAARRKGVGPAVAKGHITFEQAADINAEIADDIARLEAQQNDGEKARVFADIPMGTPGVAAAVSGLTPDRYRAVLETLAVITIAPTGKGGRTFKPGRVGIDWR